MAELKRDALGMLEIKAKQPLPATEVDDVQYDLENAQDLLHKKDEQIE